MPTIWPSMCPMGFHKTIEASDGIFETQRNAHYSLYRRAAGVVLSNNPLKVEEY